ncbi:MAG: hypothetical protein ACLFTG_11710 [Alphaproteobacteria bacterium]
MPDPMAGEDAATAGAPDGAAAARPTADADRVARVYGISPQAAESQILLQFELVALRKGLVVRAEDAVTVREFAIAIMEHVLGAGGAGREEPSGRRYTARERDANLVAACGFAGRLAERCARRAREVKRESGEPATELFRAGDRVIRLRTDARIFARLCPPPLPPIC